MNNKVPTRKVQSEAACVHFSQDYLQNLSADLRIKLTQDSTETNPTGLSRILSSEQHDSHTLVH